MQAYTYAPQNDVLYFVRSESGEVQIAASVNSFTPGSITPIANFTKGFEDPSIFVSQDESLITIYDAEEGELFLVNTLENSREKILTLKGVRDVKFSPRGEKMLIGVKLPNEPEVLSYSMFDLNTKTLEDGLLIVAENSALAWRDDNNITYAVMQEYSPFQGTLDRLRGDDSLQIVTSKDSLIVNYNLGFDKYTRVFEPETFINRLDFMSDGTVLFGDLDKVWELRFAEG